MKIWNNVQKNLYPEIEESYINSSNNSKYIVVMDAVMDFGTLFLLWKEEGRYFMGTWDDKICIPCQLDVDAYSTWVNYLKKIPDFPWE